MKCLQKSQVSPWETAVDLTPETLVCPNPARSGVSTLTWDTGGSRSGCKPSDTELLYSPPCSGRGVFAWLWARCNRTREHRPGVVTFTSSVVLRQSQQCRSNTGKWHILRDPPPDTCQWLHQLVILSDEYLPPPQLLPVASTLGAQSPGCFSGSQPLTSPPPGECVGPGTSLSLFPLL